MSGAVPTNGGHVQRLSRAPVYGGAIEGVCRGLSAVLHRGLKRMRRVSKRPCRAYCGIGRKGGRSPCQMPFCLAKTVGQDEVVALFTCHVVRSTCRSGGGRRPRVIGLARRKI